MRLNKKILSVVAIFFCGISMRAEAAVPFSNAVVKVSVAANPMDYYHPWQSVGLTASGGSGFIIEGNKIITNAHVVADHTFIQVKKEADPKKYTAHVIAEGDDCDLAILTVDDPHFFDGITPLTFGELPKLQDNVTVLGYPQGGGKLSITEGVVSRIELTVYSESARQLLTVQIDAAINPGNSGGPVMKGDKVVGVAMQVIQNSQNIGYMIPVPVIQHFFNDLEDGHYDGFPTLGIDFNSTENPTLREFYNIPKEDGGIVIVKILPFSPADGILKEGDAILKINNVPIGEDGTFKFRGEERLLMPHLITEKQIDDPIDFEIVRTGKKMNVAVKLKSFTPLVPYPKYYQKPPYYILGGLVFTVLSTDLMRSWGGNWWEKGPLDLNYYIVGIGRLNENRKKERVTLLNVLPDDINVGYHGYTNDVVTKVNDQDIDSFEGFVTLVNKLKKNEKYLIIETERESRLMLSTKDIDRITDEILKRNNIPAQYSDDVKAWLN